MSRDNAGNGLRGLRAVPSAKLLELIRRRYGLDSIDEVRDLGGSSNLNLFIATGAGRYVARVYRPYVGAARLDAVQRVRHELAKPEYRVGVGSLYNICSRSSKYNASTPTWLHFGGATMSS